MKNVVQTSLLSSATSVDFRV